MPGFENEMQPRRFPGRGGFGGPRFGGPGFGGGPGMGGGFGDF